MVFLTNTNDIPSSRVEVAVNGGSFAAFNQSVPFGGARLHCDWRMRAVKGSWMK